MKKSYLLLLLITLLLTISACSPSDNVLKIGMDLKYPPFEELDGKTPKGISVDIANGLGQYLDVPVKIVNTDFKALIPSLQAGEIDAIISSMSITDERKEIVDFSNPYMFFQIISLVNSSYAEKHQLTEDSKIADITAIKETKFTGLASQVSTTIPESYNFKVDQTTTLATAVTSVSQGSADVLLMSANPVADGHNANPNTTIIIWDSFIASPIGVAVKKGNSELLLKINNFIDTLHNNGGLYDELREKYDDVVKQRLGGRGFDFYITE